MVNFPSLKIHFLIYFLMNFSWRWRTSFHYCLLYYFSMIKKKRNIKLIFICNLSLPSTNCAAFNEITLAVAKNVFEQQHDYTHTREIRKNCNLSTQGGGGNELFLHEIKVIIITINNISSKINSIWKSLCTNCYIHTYVHYLFHAFRLRKVKK